MAAEQLTRPEIIFVFIRVHSWLKTFCPLRHFAIYSPSLLFNRRVPKSLRRHSSRLAKNFGEMTLARVADLGADLGDRQIALGQKPSRSFDSQRGQVSVRRRAGDLFEEPREMKLAQVGCSGDLGQTEF